MELKPKSIIEIEGIVSDAIEDAVSFVEGEIAEDRIKAQEYYDGEVHLCHEDGRSSVVATKVRDTVRAVKPSLMRIFLSTAKPVEYIPRGAEDVAMADQATEFMHHEFTRLNGYRVINDAFQDALVKKQGIVKAYWMTYPEAEIFTYTDLSDDEYTYLIEDDDVTVLEHSMEMVIEMDAMGMEMEMPIHSAKISLQKEKGELCIESVPPEEFFISRDARTMKDAYLVAHRTEMRAGDVVAMGFDPDEIFGLDSFEGGGDTSSSEEFARRGYDTDFSDEDPADPAMKSVTITQAYMRIDADGTGIPILHKLTCGGTKYKLLDLEPCDEVPFAKFEIDPEPHTFYGRSLAEIVMDDQDAATSVLRGILDNVAMTNNPRMAVTSGVNIDDLLNNEIGSIVRMQQMGQVQDLSVPFHAGQTLSALTYLDGLVESKTGVSRASMGLDPDAMQSTTKAALQATIQAGAGQTEVMVRNLADGMKDLFGLMLRLTHKNIDEEQMMRMNGSFVPVDPRIWDGSMDVMINVGLGTGREEEKAMALNQALQMQQFVYQNYGAQNGLVSMTNIRNTLADQLAVAGIRNADRYFAPITEEIEMQMLQQQQAAQEAQGQPQDPNAAFLQAEQMKVQAKMQADAAKLQMDMAKNAQADDLKRDQMAQDLLVDAAKIYGEYGTKVDVARVKSEQDKNRMIGGIAQGNMS